MNGINETQNTTIFAMPSNESFMGPKIQALLRIPKTRAPNLQKPEKRVRIKLPGSKYLFQFLALVCLRLI